MFNILLHFIFIIIVFYYVFIYNTKYDKSFYHTANEMKYFIYKRTAKTNKGISSYEDKFHKNETRKRKIKKMKKQCEKCEEITDLIDRRRCRELHNCDYYETVEDFSNIEHNVNYNPDYDEYLDEESRTFHDKTIFREFKIMLIMILCLILGSHQRYGVGGELSFHKILKTFSGGIENVIFLIYISVLLVMLYFEMNDLYSKKKH